MAGVVREVRVLDVQLLQIREFEVSVGMEIAEQFSLACRFLRVLVILQHVVHI